MKIKIAWFMSVIAVVLALSSLSQAFAGDIVPEITVKKCLAKASKYAERDRIQILGTLNAPEAVFYDANEIVVTIDANGIPDPNLTTWAFPIDPNSFKNGKYNFARTENASKKFFKLYTKNGKFSFMVKKTDLTGLNCPMDVKVEIGDYVAEIQLDEDIVNGKKFISLRFMTGAKDVLRVGKAKVKYGKKKTSGSDSLSVKGAFSVEDVATFQNGIANGDPIDVILGSQTFTVYPGKNVKFNLAKCEFSINIKGITVNAHGKVDFGIGLFGTDLMNPVKVNINSKGKSK